MSTTWTVTAARGALPEILKLVAEGEEVVLTRHDQPVAVVVHPSALRVRRSEQAMTEAAALRDRLVQAAGWQHAGEEAAALTVDEADALADEVRRSRDA